MKTQEEMKIKNTKKPSLWSNISLALLLAVVILVPVFVCIVLPILSLNMYADCKAANNMVVANRWLLAFCGSALLDILLIARFICNTALGYIGKLSWPGSSFLGW